MKAAVSAFQHEAAPYRGVHGFLESTADFVREGVRAGEPVLVAVLPPKIELLRDELGVDADEVRFVDMAKAGRNPARIIPLWRQFVDANAGRPVRGVGEPVWAGRSEPELAEALLHETLLNVAFNDGSPLRLRCPYDAEALGPGMIEAAHRRHPCGLPEAITEFAEPLPEVTGSVEVVDFDRMSGVRKIRALVGERAVELGVYRDRADDFALGVHEVAANSLRHGGGRGRARIWAEKGSVICEISDRGYIAQPLVGRIKPGPTQLSGRGVWLANQLCDLVQIRSSPSGTVIRIHMSR